jgi:hypothetical protein
MGWEILVIPIVVVAVWIISTVIRGADESRKANPPRRKRPEQATDLDRFLREVRRRREAAEGEEESSSRVDPEEEEPIAVEPRRPTRPRAKWQTPPEEDIAVVLPVEAVPVARLVLAAPVLRAVEAPPLPALPPNATAEALPPRPESRALVGLRQLLQSRDGLRRAMILKEVFGPPLALRRRQK